VQSKASFRHRASGSKEGFFTSSGVILSFLKKEKVGMAQAVRRGFTLIEVLIVVVIMAVLAATIIPMFSSSTEDAKFSSLKFNMHTLRSQIELYKLHHLGMYPDQIGDATRGYLPQLTHATDVNGNIGDPGPNFPYGPYLDGDIPPNPFDGKNRVVQVNLGGQKPTGVADTDGGWQYDPATGAIWPNNPEYYQQNQ